MDPFRTWFGGRRVDILTIGAATQDVFIISERFKHIRDPHAPDGFDTCFPLGAKIDLEDVIFETGGGATNAAVTFTRFGLKTSCAARLGNDPAGEAVSARLQEEGVDMRALQHDAQNRTGYSVILISGSGHRAILVLRGASRHLDAGDIAWSSLAPAWGYLTSLGGNEKALKHVFASAKKQKTRMAWNPGNAELELGLKKLTPWMLQCDIVNLNREEAAELADVAPRHMESIIRRLGPLPRQALVVTDGQKGAYVHTRDVTWFAPAIPGKRVNTTGAGDAFGSAFVAAAITTGNLETALRAGMLNAHGVITHMGAKAGILERFPTDAELKKVKIKRM